jgi:hypothetical protein
VLRDMADALRQLLHCVTPLLLWLAAPSPDILHAC